ncbi:MAG: hypothetical protein IPH07_09975 [Deltaproteobacteria bacterium]|nr:hypothetical protein [Deltaproteobacteria bacterium]MBK8718761.1 hypothetical protein [Deltaproteobacteria bacterium]MBP7286473.1 hypothetical protein [Nannocystaceae bacterium]
MPHPHPRSARAPALRWITLVVVALAIAYSNLVDVLSPWGHDVGEVSRRYQNLFTPAPYAFAIWGLIYGAFLVHCVVALLPSRRSMVIYDRLAWPLMIGNVVAALWVAVFRHEWMIASVVLIAVALVSAVVMLRRASAAVEAGKARFAITIPFALFAGWICVATIADVAATLVAFGWHGGPLRPAQWTAVMLAAATGIGLALGVGFRQFLVPAVVAWAAAAIWVADRDLDRTAMLSAAIATVVCTLAAIVLALRRATSHRPAALGAGVLGTPLPR